MTALVEFPDELQPVIVFRPDGAPAGFAEGTDLDAVAARRSLPGHLGGGQEMNKHGLIVESRLVELDPPPASERDPRLLNEGGYAVDAEGLALVILIFGLGVLEVVLLAGPAFAGRREAARATARPGHGERRYAGVLAGGSCSRREWRWSSARSPRG